MIKLMNIHHFSACKITLLFAFLITAALTPAGVAAGIYKWTDENGNVHYGSQRPEDTTSKRMKIDTIDRPYADVSTAINKKDGTDKKSDEAKKEEKKPEATAPKAKQPPKLSKKEKKTRCQQARKTLQTIESRGRVRVKDESGNSRHLTDKERSKRLARERKAVSKHCR